MKIDILTLFPAMFEGVLNESILKKAQEKQAVTFRVVNFRNYSNDKHKKVDDYPYGGGAGMVLAPQPIFDAVAAVTEENEKARILLMCPQGERFTQKKAEELSKEKHLIFVCGHYEGFDERIRQHLVTDELSIGDFILTGGELASMVMIDSIVRLIPGVLGNAESPRHESYSEGLLEHPHYTRPREFRGYKVPDVLLSGDHRRIELWRRKEALRRTWKRRPELLKKRTLTEQERRWIEEFENGDD